MVLFYSGLYRSISVSDVHLTTLAGYAVNSPSPQSQIVLHRMKETRDLPRQQATALSVVFGQHSAEPAVCCRHARRATKVGFFFQLTGSNHQVEGPLYLFDTITIFLKVVFRNSNPSWRLSLSQRALALCISVIKTACMLEGWCCDPRF